MIKINLAPLEELENKYWYLPDVILVATIVIGCWSGVNYYLDTMRDDIEQLNIKRNDFIKSTKRLKPDLERFDQLNREVDQLRKKLSSLKQITVSKIARYKPVILLEHLQNLKPDGVWYNYYSDESDEGIIRLVGNAFDSLLVAEFMSALSATRLQEFDPNDLRTQVFFSNVHLVKVSMGGSKSKEQSEKNQTKEQAAFNATKNNNIEQSKGQSYWQAGNNMFPEMKKFPGFEINIKYAERNSSYQIKIN